MNRRGFLFGLAAPAIIRVADLMPVRSVILPPKLAIVSGFTAEELASISNAAINYYWLAADGLRRINAVTGIHEIVGSRRGSA